MLQAHNVLEWSHGDNIVKGDMEKSKIIGFNNSWEFKQWTFWRNFLIYLVNDTGQCSPSSEHQFFIKLAKHHFGTKLVSFSPKNVWVNFNTLCYCNFFAKNPPPKNWHNNSQKTWKSFFSQGWVGEGGSSWPKDKNITLFTISSSFTF